MIPDRELERFVELARTAVEYAESGRLAAGHARLMVGWQESRALDVQRHPWASDLVARYHYALQCYSDSYSVLRFWQPAAERVTGDTGV